MARPWRLREGTNRSNILRRFRSWVWMRGDEGQPGWYINCVLDHYAFGYVLLFLTINTTFEAWKVAIPCPMLLSPKSWQSIFPKLYIYIYKPVSPKPTIYNTFLLRSPLDSATHFELQRWSLMQSLMANTPPLPGFNVRTEVPVML